MNVCLNNWGYKNNNKGQVIFNKSPPLALATSMRSMIVMLWYFTKIGLNSKS